MRKAAIVILVLLAAGIAARLWTRTLPPAEKRLSISFQGYSNSPSGKAYALFALTNHDPCDLELWNGGAVEFSENVSLTNGRPPGVEVLYSLVGSNLCHGQAYTMFTE